MQRALQMGHKPSSSIARHTWVVCALALTACAGVVDDGFDPGGAGDRLGGAGTVMTTCGMTEREPLHRLTRSQMQNSIVDALGVSSVDISSMPQNPRAAGFELAGPMGRLETTAWLGIAEAAGAAAAQRAPFVGCTGSSCLDALLNRAAPLLYRRPLAADESQRVRAFYQSALQSGNATSAVADSVAAMLMSPQFLYHDGYVSGSTSGTLRPSDHELVSKLAYFLWNGPPDADLLESISDGRLSAQGGLRALASEMMDDPRFARGALEFFAQLLQLEPLAQIDRSSDSSFTAQHAVDLRASIDAFIRYAVVEQDSLDILLSSNRVYLNRRLGALYGHPEVTSDQMVPVEFPSTQRVGLLTQPAVLALWAKRDQTDPIHRGLFVLRQVLCVEFGPPPAAVGQPAPPSANATTRERFSAHRANAACASCHDSIDPVGFAFENFDLVGRYRATENGVPVNATGDVAAPADVRGHVQNAAELAERVRTSQSVSSCMATQWMRYAIRREPQTTDSCQSQAIANAFRQGSGSFRALLLAIIESQLFQLAGTPS